MGQIPALWQQPVASRVALDLPYWVMRSVPHRLIRMAIKMTSEGGVFFAIVDFLSCITIAKRPCYAPYKITADYIISS